MTRLALLLLLIAATSVPLITGAALRGRIQADGWS